MAWTKRQLIDKAFAELGINYTFDKEPHEYMLALQSLDSMMAAWSITMPLPYPTSNTADNTSLDTSSNLPDFAVQGVWASLAVMLCAAFGKAVPPSLLQMATDGKTAIKIALSQCPPRLYGQRNLMYLGAGNQPVPNYTYWRGKIDYV